jgi:hypothetical protein
MYPSSFPIEPAAGWSLTREDCQGSWNNYLQVRPSSPLSPSLNDLLTHYLSEAINTALKIHHLRIEKMAFSGGFALSLELVRVLSIQRAVDGSTKLLVNLVRELTNSGLNFEKVAYLLERHQVDNRLTSAFKTAPTITTGAAAATVATTTTTMTTTTKRPWSNVSKSTKGGILQVQRLFARRLEKSKIYKHVQGYITNVSGLQRTPRGKIFQHMMSNPREYKQKTKQKAAAFFKRYVPILRHSELRSCKMASPVLFCFNSRLCGREWLSRFHHGSDRRLLLSLYGRPV